MFINLGKSGTPKFISGNHVNLVGAPENSQRLLSPPSFPPTLSGRITGKRRAAEVCGRNQPGQASDVACEPSAAAGLLCDVGEGSPCLWASISRGVEPWHCVILRSITVLKIIEIGSKILTWGLFAAPGKWYACQHCPLVTGIHNSGLTTPRRALRSRPPLPKAGRVLASHPPHPHPTMETILRILNQQQLCFKKSFFSLCIIGRSPLQIESCLGRGK